MRNKVQSIPAYKGLGISLDNYVELFGLVDISSYGHLKKIILDKEEYISGFSPELSCLFNQYLLLILVCEFDISKSNYNIPDSVRKNYCYELNRIVGQFDTFNLEFYKLSNDEFLKDLAILAHRLIPVGAEFIVPYSGVPRALFFKSGVFQFFKGLWSSFICSGGVYPFVELHAHTLSMNEFNPEGWLKTYVTLAEFLEKNTIFRGVVSSSWFLDPALEEITPHLSYLRKVPEENGATILFNCWDKEGKSGALDKSKSRRRLFEGGEYEPAIYTRVWPRKKIISFKNSML